MLSLAPDGAKNDSNTEVVAHPENKEKEARSESLGTKIEIAELIHSVHRICSVLRPKNVWQEM